LSWKLEHLTRSEYAHIVSVVPFFHDHDDTSTMLSVRYPVWLRATPLANFSASARASNASEVSVSPIPVRKPPIGQWYPLSRYGFMLLMLLARRLLGCPQDTPSATITGHIFLSHHV
jgi:hypothetical protein